MDKNLKSNFWDFYWLICPTCYESVKVGYGEIVAYTVCGSCGRLWFQQGEGLPDMSNREQAHYQIEYLKSQTLMDKG